MFDAHKTGMIGLLCTTKLARTPLQWHSLVYLHSLVVVTQY